MMALVRCESCGREQRNRKSEGRVTPSPIPGCLPHGVFETTSDYAAGCVSCGHLYATVAPARPQRPGSNGRKKKRR